MYKYALLLDNLVQSAQTEIYLKELISKPQYDITLFVISKENTVYTPFAVFSIVDLYNFEGNIIITSFKTLEKSKVYPTIGPRIIIGNLKYGDYLNVQTFNMDLINGTINDRNKENEKNKINAK